MEKLKDKEFKVFVVDDNDVNLKLINEMLLLSKFDYKILLFYNAEELYEKLNERNLPDIFLLDIDLPTDDGFQICEKIRNKYKILNIPVIFVTAFSDEEHIKKGFDVGGNDYITKPIKHYDLIARVNTNLKLKKYNDLLLEKNKKLNLMYNDLDAEVNTASILIDHIIKSNMNKKLKIDYGYFYKPKLKIGGDYLEIIKNRNNSLTFIIADVMGHGIKSALIMSLLKSIISVYSPLSLTPGKFLNKINNVLVDIMENPSFSYSTMFVINYDLETKIIKYANAAHIPPIYYDSLKKEESRLKKNGFPLGIEKNKFYEEGELTIKNNDFLLLFSDGLLKEENDENNLIYLNNCLTYILNKFPTINNLQDVINDFFYKQVNADFLNNQIDDITLLGIKF